MKTWRLKKDLPGWDAGTLLEYDEYEHMVFLPDSYPRICFKAEVFPDWFELVDLEAESQEKVEYPCAHGRDSRGSCYDCEHVKTEVLKEPLIGCGTFKSSSEKENMKPSEWIRMETRRRLGSSYTRGQIDPMKIEVILSFLDQHFKL